MGCMPMSSPLFQPYTFGPIPLKHRVVLCPLTRYKVDAAHVPLLPLMKEYYTQRASTPGTLLIAEATIIAAKAGGFLMPGIWSQDQIKAWKEVTDSVHARGSFTFLQILAQGRNATLSILKDEDPSLDLVGPSNVPISPDDEDKPHPLTVAEIEEYVGLYVQAAKNAIQAGFDGVEIHGANGFLVDQFLQDVSNDRADDYGGSIENRARFPLAVVKAVAEVVGEERTGIRFSPWSPFAGMGMADPVPTFSHVISEIRRLHPKLAYLHLIEPRINADSTAETTAENAAQSNEVFFDLWGDRPLIVAGGHTRESAMKLAAERENVLVAFGRHFLANPDLPLRLEKNLPLNPYDRSTFYLAGQNDPKGYTDYPFAE
ncbi:NADH:flavin oxidoreductase/NADH oxidase [Roridomyces roridus]|uniref:NADH:flavin oxidoreductase/NADH oxidase n=1 Tax=Roridomyces roridus TaxID=1738132 RepID=A0AAD7BXJ0_9AGAR|nr:NADH:flavin oxidoreductase/NADH oxidase [Roridomyces roridus]